MSEQTNQTYSKFKRKALRVEEARQAILNNVKSIDTEKLELKNAIGRRLAEDVYTKAPIPHFRRSGMDGYAVRYEDIKSTSSEQPVELVLTEHIPCGVVPTRVLTAGTTARIMTGGMVPDGADVVVMQEMTEEVTVDGKTLVRIRKSVPAGQNITPIGEECEAGERMLEQGCVIGAGETALLAALGYPEVTVFRKPKVAIISTGTELLDVSEPLQQGKIRNSNAYMARAQIQSAGGEASIIQHIPDEQEQVERMIYDLLSSEYDIVVTTGGVSVGDYDIMADFFTNWEGKTLFNKIAMRPGSPTSAGVWKNKLLFGLSGNPAACFVGIERFVRPALLKMQGSSEEDTDFTAFLAEDYLKVNAFTRFVRGRRYVENGKVYVKLVGIDKSSIMTSLKDANCLIEIPPTKTGFKAGEMIQAIAIREW